MGNEIKEETVLEMEDVLGLREEEAEVVETKDNAPDVHLVDKKEETSATKTTIVTDEQIAINSEITKIDVQIEALEKETVDTSKFYNNLEEELTEVEQALEFSDKPAYMKLVNEKSKEYEAKHSKTDEIATLKDEKEEKQLVYDRQSAIVAVSAKYPDYKHENVLAFFEQDLNKTQQKEIFEASISYADVYEKTYEKLKGLNPEKIKSEPAPNIPDLNNVRREVAQGEDTSSGLDSEEQSLRDALGL